MITLYYNGGESSVEIQPSDESYRYRALMSFPELSLKFSLAEYIEFPVGTWCTYRDETYTLYKNQQFTKNGTRNYDYTLLMKSDISAVELYKFYNPEDKRLKWSACSTPKEYAEYICAVLNEREGGSRWLVGDDSDYLDSTEKTIEFNQVYISEALQTIADEFDTEWEIVGDGSTYYVYFHKVEYNAGSPVALAYGKGNGFIPGLGRTTPDDDVPIKRLYVQGGDTNISRSEYKSTFGCDSQYLLLPTGTMYDAASGYFIAPRISYDGSEFTRFDSESKSEDARTYSVDENGYYIYRVDEESDAIKDDSIDCSDIYPSRVGTIAYAAEEDGYWFIYDADSSIPDYESCLIEGETMTIIFQSGMLGGKEFDVDYTAIEGGKTVTDSSGNEITVYGKFHIVSQEIDGITMPETDYGYYPAAGDTYAVFNVMLPSEYVCENDTMSGASWDMFREAARYLYEHEEQKFTFTGTLQGKWAKENWSTIGSKLFVGSYVKFTDDHFAADGVLIRITGIKDYLNSPYTPTIEISNSVNASTVRSELREIAAQEVAMADKTSSVLNFTKRRFRDVTETAEALESAVDSLSADFTTSIAPISVQTMQLIAGDEALQFCFVTKSEDDDGNTVWTTASWSATWSSSLGLYNNSASYYIQHMTLGIDAITSEHDTSEYKHWPMPRFTLKPDDSSLYYYLYACVSAVEGEDDGSTAGSWVLSSTSISLNSESDKYYLLVGILSSEYDGTRSFTTVYGYTEILPGRITTDRVVSSDGNTYFDLAGNSVKIGEMLTFNTEGDGELVVTNGAKIGDWVINDEGLIVSADGSIELNAVTNSITVTSEISGGDSSADTTLGSVITIDADTGVVKAKTTSGSYCSYLSPTGIFANRADTSCIANYFGSYRAAICAHGNGALDYGTTISDSYVCGLYADASNTGTALSYGASIFNLKANGIVLNTVYLDDTNSSRTLSDSASLVIGLASGATSVILPAAERQGQTIFFKQWGSGYITITPPDGYLMYDDTSENTSYNLGTGYSMVAHFVRVSISGETEFVWLITRFG